MIAKTIAVAFVLGLSLLVAGSTAEGGVAGCTPIDDCECAGTIIDGVHELFIDSIYNTDGPPVPECGGQIQFDRWWNYTAPCTGTLTVTSSNFDVAHAVALYDNWACPPSDADVLGCVVGTIQEFVTIQVPVTQGQQLKFRVGSWGGDTGSSIDLSISCGPAQCGDPGTGDCCQIGGNGGASCSDVACCEAVSAILPHCAEMWDGVCAAQATVTCTLCGGPPFALDCNDNGIADGTELLTAPFIGRLTANNIMPDAYFGYALAARGSKLIVGAYGENSEQGAVYFYKDLAGNLGAWKHEVRRAPGTAGSRFGISVGIQGGNAIVGADRDSDAGLHAGAAHVFFDAAPTGGTWQQAFKITPGDAAAGDHFGASVAVFGDRCIIGAPDAAAGGSGRGKAYVYRTNIPDQIAILTASDGVDGDNFGASAAMRSSGYAVIGAPLADGTVLPDVGAAYVFRNQGGWQEVAKLLADDPQQFVGFGQSVAIDGDIIVVGAPADPVDGLLNGSAYVFRETSLGSGEWNQVAKLTASDASDIALFGRSVDVSGDTIVVGAPAQDNLGAAYVFREQPVGSGQFHQVTPVHSNMGAANEQFGTSVAATGDVIVVGEWRDTHVGEPAAGSAAIHRKPALDCNGNFIPDDCDTDDNANGVPDDCEDKDPCALGDINCDGVVGTGDLLDLLAAWGKCNRCPEDIDGDGTVGTSDLLMLLANWG